MITKDKNFHVKEKKYKYKFKSIQYNPLMINWNWTIYQELVIFSNYFISWFCLVKRHNNNPVITTTQMCSPNTSDNNM
jgi:hypothetical protein